MDFCFKDSEHRDIMALIEEKLWSLAHHRTARTRTVTWYFFFVVPETVIKRRYDYYAVFRKNIDLQSLHLTSQKNSDELFLGLNS